MAVPVPTRAACVVCFVCTGNICRSPMADVVLRRLAARGADGRRLGPGRPSGISSAGTGGWHAGEPMDPRARAALERRATPTTATGPGPSPRRGSPRTDLVVCLDRGHQQTLVGLARRRAGDDRYEDRLVLLRSFDPRAGGAVDVPDPYYGDDADFERCLDHGGGGCRGLVGRRWSDRLVGWSGEGDERLPLVGAASARRCPAARSGGTGRWPG